MAKKKGSRVLVGLISEETGAQIYVSQRNKVNTTEPLRLRKYDPKLNKHVWFKERKKLD